MDAAVRRELRRAARAVTRSREQRDAAILAAHEAGATLREIAGAVGLSHPGVLKIIQRHKENGQ